MDYWLGGAPSSDSSDWTRAGTIPSSCSMTRQDLERIGFYTDIAQVFSATNAATLRSARLNSTPIRWIGCPRWRYFAA